MEIEAGDTSTIRSDKLAYPPTKLAAEELIFHLTAEIANGMPRKRQDIAHAMSAERRCVF